MRQLWPLPLLTARRNICGHYKGVYLSVGTSLSGTLMHRCSTCIILIIMYEGQNPFNGVESFDTVYFATLQTIVLASANTVSV